MSEPDENPVALSAYLQPSLSAARRARNREAVQRRINQPAKSAARYWAGAAVCAGALAFAMFALLGRGSYRQEQLFQTWEPAAGAVLTSQQHALVASLPDGTRLELEAETTLAALATPVREAKTNASQPPSAGTNAPPSGVELELHRGRASFDVTHNLARIFRVRAGNVWVAVLGTRFSVERRNGAVTVAVERGKVAVESGATVTYLTPGQHWEGAERTPHSTADRTLEASESAPPPATQGAATTTPPATQGAATTTPPATEGPATTTPPATAVTTGESAGRALDVSPRPVHSNTSTATADAPATASSAKELFEASREARRVGDSRRAAQLLQQLVAQYPSDPRAGLAAFELGRIRADVLGDLSGAITALEQALRLSPHGGFRQDALARLVQAYDRAGRTAACKATRQRYLAVYGDGVHAQRVLKLCP